MSQKDLNTFEKLLDLHDHIGKIIPSIRSHYPKGTSALDVKDVTAPQFGHSDVVCLSIFSNEHQKVPCHSSEEMLNKWKLY